MKELAMVVVVGLLAACSGSLPVEPVQDVEGAPALAACEGDVDDGGGESVGGERDCGGSGGGPPSEPQKLVLTYGWNDDLWIHVGCVAYCADGLAGSHVGTGACLLCVIYYTTEGVEMIASQGAQGAVPCAGCLRPSEPFSTSNSWRGSAGAWTPKNIRQQLAAIQAYKQMVQRRKRAGA